MENEHSQELNQIKNLLEDLKNQLEQDEKINEEGLGEIKDRLEKAWDKINDIPNQPDKESNM